MSALELRDRSAVISPCGRYRTRLTRGAVSEPSCTFIMLNPSTADAELDDPTIRRCIGFAKREGCEHLIVVNLFTARATDPAHLLKVDDPVGPDAKEAIEDIFNEYWPGNRLICAWGACHAKWPGWFLTLRQERIDHVLDYAGALKRPLHALGFTADGSPRHPLYVKSDTPLVPYPCGFSCGEPRCRAEANYTRRK